MPTDALLSEPRTFARAFSPDNVGSESSRKRRRKVLSCFDCRRRKLQCDRGQPACSRCAKAGQSCLYIEDSAEIAEHEEVPPPSASKGAPSISHAHHTNQPKSSNGDALARLEYQDERIKQLESALAQTTATNHAIQRLRTSLQPQTPDSVAGTTELSAPVRDREAPLLRGRNFKTQFHGNTDIGIMMARLPALGSFTRETFEQFPALLKVREDIGVLEDRIESAGSDHRQYSDDELKQMLPSRSEADDLVNIYFKNYGNIYQIFHLPSFWSEYESLWADRTNASIHFVAILHCIMAAAQCLTSTHPWLYVGSSSVAREKAIAAIHAVENWLALQSQKHVTAADFQVRFLLLFAKQVSARKTKRTWTEVGDLLRFCMSAGLHRNPDLIRKPTALLERELRKRLWAAVTELELQAAFDRGMLCAPWILQSDCPAPSQILDEEISKNSEHMPAPRRSSAFTSVSFLAASAESITLRTTINTNLNSIRYSVSFDDTKRYTDEIEAHLQGQPIWSGQDADVPAAMLSLNLRQYLLVLHCEQVRLTESKSERDYSRMVVLNTATKIIDTHHSLTTKGYYGLELLRSDHLRAALAICHLTEVADPRADTVLSSMIEYAAKRVIPDVVELLIDKVYRFGCEQRQLWVLLVSSAFFQSRHDPSKRLAYMQEAVDKITRPFYKIMACQSDSALAASKSGNSRRKRLRGTEGRHVDGNELSGSYTNGKQLPDPAASQTHPNTLSLEDFNFDELAGWTFDDFMFDPNELSAINPPPPLPVFNTPSGAGDAYS